MPTVRVAFTDDVVGKISGSGGECDNASATTSSLPKMCLMSVVNSAMSNRYIFGLCDLFVVLKLKKKSVACDQ